MTVHISRVEVRNFRNFEHLVLDPFPPSAVILGENGVGKSNLLHALRLVLDPSLPDTARLLRHEDIWEGHPHGLSGGARVTVAIELSGYDDDDDAKAVLSDCTVEVNPLRARLTYQFYPRVKVIHGGVNEETDHVLSADDYDHVLSADDYDFVIFGGVDEGNDVRRVRRDVGLRVLHALRDAESDLQSWRRNPMRTLLERLPLDPANLAATATAMGAAASQLLQDPNVGKLQTHIANRLSDMTGPRLPLDPRIGFASTQADELVRSIRLFVDSQMTRSVGETSLGSANVLYLALLIEALEQQRIDDLFVQTILAVEEPEAHLHVSLQRRLFSYLLRSESTLLLTTHSPHIAAVAPLKSLVVLRESTNGTIGRTSAGLSLSHATAEDIERYLDVSRAEILFASAVVLVEGVAESYVLPSLAQNLGFDLDSYGVVVSSVHGADFGPYRKLLGPGGLDIPHVIVTDGDATADRRGRREAGLKRAAKLLESGATAALERVKLLPEPGDEAYRIERNQELRLLAEAGVFVGGQTLEVDLCEMFGEEIIAAFNEVERVTPARVDVQAGVENENSRAPEASPRTAMLKRISAVGKGRFAQRLAAHLDTADVRERLLDLLEEGCVTADAEGMVQLGGSGYIFGALDAISRIVRDQPLMVDDE